MTPAEALLWAAAEKEFEEFFPGKRSYVYAFEDTKEARKGTTRRVVAKDQPADYLVTHEGVTFFAEVKFTSDPDRFSFSGIRKGQFQAATQCVFAGGLYFFFIKSGVRQKWYRVPASFILSTYDTKKSLRWDELEPYVYHRN